MLRVLFGPELADTIPSIVLVVLVSVALFAYILAAARRRNSYATAAMPLLAAAWGGVALATGVAAWILVRTFFEMAETGGGIAALGVGVWQSARVMLVSTWIAAAATLLALAVGLRSARDGRGVAESRSFWPTGAVGAVAIAAGLAAVLLFRGTVTALVDMTLPGHSPAWWVVEGSPLSRSVYTLVTAAGLAGVVGFAIALLLAMRTLRRGAAPLRVMVAMVVLSLCVSSGLVVSLRSFSSCWGGRIALDRCYPEIRAANRT